MKYPDLHPIHTNFDTSIILPFYKKLFEFEKVLGYNAVFFQRNGVEVLVVMDEPSEEADVLTLIRKYPLINWKVLVNRIPHAWRNPGKAINAGIRAATKKYVLVCSPESRMYNDVLFRLRYMAEYYDPCFAVGRVSFGTFDRPGRDPHSLTSLHYGSIMVKKEYLQRVGAYSEHFDKWGGEDDNIRSKLEYAGIRKIEVYDALMVHYETEEKGFDKR